MSRLPDALRDHIISPRNAGEPQGGFDHRGEAVNGACRDHLVLYLVRDDEGGVARAGFRAKGCPAAMALGSAVTELLVGLPIDDALPEATLARYVDAFGEPAPLHRHALTLVKEALTGLTRKPRSPPRPS
jgi:NifU-like protein